MDRITNRKTVELRQSAASARRPPLSRILHISSQPTRCGRGLLISAVLVSCSGCWKPPPVAARQEDVGLVWLLPGIEGGPNTLCWAHAAFRDAGVESAIRVFDWERPCKPLDNLTDYDGNLVKADAIAKQITDFREHHPQVPIDVVGYSGGGGLAIMVAEALPEEVRLRNVVLAQPALSPDYDLTAALRHIDGKLVNFYSPHDWLVLGWGTRAFGTMDRKKTDSAGKVRFDLEHAVADPTLLDKVVQKGWNLQMLGNGHFGNHLSILSYYWNRQYIAPYLLGL